MSNVKNGELIRFTIYGILDCICNEQETKGCTIPSFHIDAFILKATLMAEWTSEKEFDRPSTAQAEKLVAIMNDDYVDVPEMMKLCRIVRRKTMQDSYIAPALADGSIERKYPEQPNHPKQMYRITEKAKTWKKSLIK